MLCDLDEILQIAEDGGFAVPSFNVYNAETVLGVMRAAEETKAPVIFQMYSRLFDTGLARFIAPVILEAIHALQTPAAFHLDHGAGEPEVIRALRYGASGIMIDASTLPLEENIAQTRKIVEIAREVGVSVEGELGHVGSAQADIWAEYTKVDEAVRYVDETGIKALAIMVGSAHGHYKQAPILAIDRIAKIHASAKAHLVLHGGSGIPDDQIRAAIDAGIRKINYATDICSAYINGCCVADPKKLPLDVYLSHPTEYVKNFAIEKINLLGAAKVRFTA